MTKKLLFSAITLLPLIFSAQQKFSIIPSVGYAWRTAKTSPELSSQEKEYVKGLKNGVNFDISAYYHLKNEIGIGLKYSNFNASSDGMLSVIGPDGETYSGSVSTKDNISFFGPAFIYSNYNLETRHKLYYDLALGVITYSSKTGGAKITGSNLGLDANIAYQYAVSSQIFVGPKLGYTVGTLTKIKMNGQTIDLGENKEGLGRVSLSFAATFRF